MSNRRPTPKTQTSVTGQDSSETNENDSDANDGAGSADLSEADHAALMSPGPIEVRSREHARMIRATGNEDNPRIVGLGNYPDAMPRDDDDSSDDTNEDDQ
jgi:hypothetical protein